MEAELISYLPSLGHYRRWMARRLEGMDSATAWREVYEESGRDYRRHMARTMVAGAHGQSPLTLSVPIEGGASVVKRGHPERWGVSMHGRWQEVHIGALAAAYSASPFYRHIAPDINAILRDSVAEMTFLELTFRLHRVVADVMDLESLFPELVVMKKGECEKLDILKREKNYDVCTDLTILDVIFKKGPEALFLLL